MSPSLLWATLRSTSGETARPSRRQTPSSCRSTSSVSIGRYLNRIQRLCRAGISRLTLLQMSTKRALSEVRSMIFRSAIMAAIVIESASSRMTIWMPFSNMVADPAMTLILAHAVDAPVVRGVQLQHVAVLLVDLPHRALDELVLPVPAGPCSSRCGRLRAST